MRFLILALAMVLYAGVAHAQLDKSPAVILLGNSSDGQVLVNDGNVVTGTSDVTVVSSTLVVTDLDVLPDDGNNGKYLDDNPTAAGGYDCVGNAPATGDMILNADSDDEAGFAFFCLPDGINYKSSRFEADSSIEFSNLNSLATRGNNKSNRVDINFASLNAVSDGAMNITIDSTTSDVTGMDFAAATVTSVQEICDVVQPRIRAVGGEFAAAICEVHDTLTRILISSGTFGATTSHVSFASAPSSGTDVSGNTFLELDSTDGTITSGIDAGGVYALAGDLGDVDIGATLRMSGISADDGEQYLTLRVKADVLCDGGSCGTFESELQVQQSTTSSGNPVTRISATNLSQVRISRGTASSEAYGLLLEDEAGDEAGWLRPAPGIDLEKSIWQLPNVGGNSGVGEGDYTDGSITPLASGWRQVILAPGNVTATEFQMTGVVIRSITGVSIITLPIINSLNIGMHGCFYDDVGAVITLNPGDATDHIDLLGVNIVAGDTLVSAGTKGDYICLKAIEADTWIAVDEFPTGKWSDGGP